MYAQVPLLEEVTFFMVWFDPDLPVLRIHLNNTGPTARLTARRYRAQISMAIFCCPHTILIKLRCAATLHCCVQILPPESLTLVSK